MPESEVVRLMREFKRAIADAGTLQQRAMANRWLALERRLSGNIAALALEMTARQAAGLPISVSMLLNETRYRELLIQLQDELATYTTYAERTITNGQQAMASAGVQQASQAIAAQVSTSFNRLPVAAVEHMVGLTGAGMPLNTLLVQSWPIAAQNLTTALVDGVALGYNPRKVARNMAEGMTGTLNRMMTIARTETLRVYNESSRQQYISSGIVTSYTRIAAHDNRTCLHCIVLEGTVYPTNELMPSHPNCRCALLPLVNGAPKPQWLKGEDWFMAQDSATQESIMGKGRYELWRTGKIGLADSTQVVPNPVWGDTLRTVPLRELT
jgi:SPP1 gp7 family putative phage head morphogenesis protein